MADIVFYWADHWFDTATPERQAEVDINRKFDGRYKKGDIIDIYETGRLAYCRHPKFRVLRIEDLSILQAKNYLTNWQRDFSTTRTLNDTTNGRFEYRLDIIQESISGKELWDEAKEILDGNKPEWLEILSRSPTSIEVGFDGDIERRNRFEAEAKDMLQQLRLTIARARYYINYTILPITIQNKLNSSNTVDWIISGYTISQIRPYIYDKISEEHV